MIVKPKTRGFICTTAHPAGCARNVEEQIEYVERQQKFEGPKKVLVIGASTGYGLASRIAVAFGAGAATLGVLFEKPASGNRTASAGWYNTAAFESAAAAKGLYAKSINGDAFSEQVKQQTIRCIQQDLGQIDLVVYSLAAPRRTMEDGSVFASVLKTTGEPYTNKTIDLKKRTLSEVTIEPATPEEIQATVKVMGGEDWMQWMQALKEAGVLSEQAKTVAYTYIGPELTFPIYRNGSIGQAKAHLYDTSKEICQAFPGIQACISVNKALVTQSSAAIPIVPLYISMLYKIMKEKNIHEGCAQQMYRLFAQNLYTNHPNLDACGRIRVDDWEMRGDVQAAIDAGWAAISDANLDDLLDIDGYWEDFYRMFGFQIPGVDYEQDVQIDVPIPSIQE